MKTKTVLKAIGFLIGLLGSIQLITVGTHLTNQPSSIAFALGAIMTLVLLVLTFVFAGKFVSTLMDLVVEYARSKEVKQEEPEQEAEEEVKQEKEE